MCKGYPLYLIFELGVQFVQKTVNTADLKADPLKAVQVINCLEFAQWKGQTGDDQMPEHIFLNCIEPNGIVYLSKDQLRANSMNL